MNYNTQKIKTGCRVCGSHKRCNIVPTRSDTFDGKKRIYHLFKCSVCGLKYIEPQPSRDSIEALYDNQRYYDEIGTDGFNEDGTLQFPSYKINLYKSILDKVDSYLHHNKMRVLDIGCGWGHFLKMVKDKGWEAQGVELSKASTDYVRNKLGINVFNGLLEEALFNTEDFDVIYMGDVLEHMPEPFETLLEARRILRANGIIVIKIPNTASPLARIALLYLNFVFYIKPEKNLFLHHLYHFTSFTLKKGIENCGFKYLETIFFQVPFPTKTKGILRDIIVNTIAKLCIIPSHKTSLIMFARK